MESLITEAEKSLIKWQYGVHGSFDTFIWKAIAAADDGNLDKLAIIFPDEIAVYRRYIGEKGYWKDVQRRAGKVYQ